MVKHYTIPSIYITYINGRSLKNIQIKKSILFGFVCQLERSDCISFSFIFSIFFFASVERLLFAHSILCETAPVSNSNHLLAETISVTQYHSFMRILLLFFFFTFFVLRALFFALHSD